MITLRVSRMKPVWPRRVAIVLAYPVMVALTVPLAVLDGLRWFIGAQITLATGAREQWRRN